MCLPPNDIYFIGLPDGNHLRQLFIGSTREAAIALVSGTQLLVGPRHHRDRDLFRLPSVVVDERLTGEAVLALFFQFRGLNDREPAFRLVAAGRTGSVSAHNSI